MQNSKFWSKLPKFILCVLHNWIFCTESWSFIEVWLDALFSCSCYSNNQILSMRLSDLKIRILIHVSRSCATVFWTKQNLAGREKCDGKLEQSEKCLNFWCTFHIFSRTLSTLCTVKCLCVQQTKSWSSCCNWIGLFVHFIHALDAKWWSGSAEDCEMSFLKIFGGLGSPPLVPGDFVNHFSLLFRNEKFREISE